MLSQRLVQSFINEKKNLSKKNKWFAEESKISALQRNGGCTNSCWRQVSLDQSSIFNGIAIFDKFSLFSKTLQS